MNSFWIHFKSFHKRRHLNLWYFDGIKGIRLMLSKFDFAVCRELPETTVSFRIVFSALLKFSSIFYCAFTESVFVIGALVGNVGLYAIEPQQRAVRQQ